VAYRKHLGVKHAKMRVYIHVKHQLSKSFCYGNPQTQNESLWKVVVACENPKLYSKKTDAWHAHVFWVLLPVGSVQRAVLDSFRHVVGMDFVFLLKVGNCTRNTQDSVIGAGRQTEMCNGLLHLLLAFGIQLAEAPQSARRHLSVAVNAEPFQPLFLNITGVQNAASNYRRFFGPLILSQLFVLDGRDLNVEINPVEQRS
jgi:hypothetical protein